MPKKHNVHRISDTKKNRPFIRFNFWMLIIIFSLSFLGCFILYMLAANLDDNFFDYSSSDSSDNVSSEAPTEASDDISDSSADVTTPPPSEPVKTVVNPVPESPRADDSYFDNAWILADPSFLDMKYNSSIKNILGNDTLNAVNVNDHKVESVYGTITAFQNIQIINPETVYIMLGADIATSAIDDMINSYSVLIANIISNMPSTEIYIMQLPPVYSDSDTVTNDHINEYNSRLLQLADSKSIHCVDTNTILKNNAGSLDEQYWSAEENSLSSAAYSTIYEYLLTHTAQ